MSDIKTQLEKADQLFEGSKFQETVDLLQSLDQSNANVLWRNGRALYKLAGIEANKDKRPELIREAFKFVEQALVKDEQNYACHKWFAILLDAKSNLDGIKERVTQL